jgi:glyoxylase I family protein
MPDLTLRHDHIALPIYDPAATLDFYTGVLGLPLTNAMNGEDWGGKPWLMMFFALGDGREIALCALKGDAKPKARLPADLPHFALSAPDELALKAWEHKLTDAGVAFEVEHHGAQRSLYFQDPNGIMLEITAPPSEADARSSERAAAMVRKWAET